MPVRGWIVNGTYWFDYVARLIDMLDRAV